MHFSFSLLICYLVNKVNYSTVLLLINCVGELQSHLFGVKIGLASFLFQVQLFFFVVMLSFSKTQFLFQEFLFQVSHSHGCFFK
jgi:hypothetical protein